MKLAKCNFRCSVRSLNWIKKAMVVKIVLSLCLMWTVCQGSGIGANIGEDCSNTWCNDPNAVCDWIGCSRRCVCRDQFYFVPDDTTGCFGRCEPTSCCNVLACPLGTRCHDCSCSLLCKEGKYNKGNGVCAPGKKGSVIPKPGYETGQCVECCEYEILTTGLGCRNGCNPGETLVEECMFGPDGGYPRVSDSCFPGKVNEVHRMVKRGFAHSTLGVPPISTSHRNVSIGLCCTMHVRFEDKNCPSSCGPDEIYVPGYTIMSGYPQQNSDNGFYCIPF